MPTSIRSSSAFVAVIIASWSWLPGPPAEPDSRTRPTVPATSPGDPCALLTKQDAAAALGESVTGPKVLSDRPAGPGSTVSMCKYAGSGMHKVQLNLTRLAPGSTAMFRGMCAEKSSPDLKGLGEVACWYNAKHEELHALKGDNFLSVELQRSGDPTEAIKGVMKHVLERLR